MIKNWMFMLTLLSAFYCLFVATPAKADTFRWPPIRLEGTDEVEVLENVLDRLDLLNTLLEKEIPDKEMWDVVVSYDQAKKKYSFIVEIGAAVSEAKVAELERTLRRAVPDVAADTETRIKELEAEIRELQQTFDPDGHNSRLNLLQRLWMVRLATRNSTSGYYWTVEVKHGDNTIPGDVFGPARVDDELSSTDAISLVMAGVLTPLDQIVRNRASNGQTIRAAYRYLELSGFSLHDIIFLEHEESGWEVYWRQGIRQNVKFDLSSIKNFERRFESEVAETFLKQLEESDFDQKELPEQVSIDDGLLIIVAKWENGRVLSISEQALGVSEMMDDRLPGLEEGAARFWKVINENPEK